MNTFFCCKLLLSCLGLFLSLACYGRYITFETKDHQPIVGVLCTGYTVSNDSIGAWTTNEKGKADIKEDGVDHIVASHPGFRDKVIFLNQLKADDSTVVMSPAVDLEEVVVTPSDVEEFDTHTSYRISQKDMERYSTVLQSLNEIPNMTVLTNGAVFYQGDENVKILIDGVDATTQEIQALSKEDIAKVDVYRNPPIRFIAQGVETVLDIRLKSKIHGGNGAVDISQAFSPLKGNNSAAMFYNYRQSRFSLMYNNENSHYKKYRKSEVLDYEFDGVHYKKVKDGIDSKNHYDDNNLNLSYQINKPQNFLYNIKTGLSFNRNGGTSLQNVHTGVESFLATNKLYTSYTRFNVANYFEKNFGERFGSLLANVNYQHFSNSYNSAYDEKSDDELAVNDSHSDYKTCLDAVFSEVQYQLPPSKLGYISFVLFETYKRSKYIDTTYPFYQTTNSFGGLAEWAGYKGKIGWYATLGVNWYRTSSTHLANPYNLCVPSPRINFRWKPSRAIYFSLDYSYTGNVPNIAQLSETNQWIDTKLVYHGNSTLKPYKTHSFGARFVLNSKYIDLSVLGSFESSPGMICDMYTMTDQYMLQTMVNLSKYRMWKATTDISFKPLGNNKLVFWNRINLADLRGSNNEYSWRGHRFQWMSQLSLNLDHWTAILFYQYPGKVVEGQLERPRAQCWSATVLYRPMTNLSVGLEWFMPFGNGFKESERTVNAAPVYADTETKIMDWSNMVSIKLSYNFSFGRNRNKAHPQYSNGDNDSGILRK